MHQIAVLSRLLRPTYCSPSATIAARPMSNMTSPASGSSKTSIFDWKVIPTGPGGMEPAFVNNKTKESTYNPPSGYSAEEIAQLPSARKFIGSVGEIQKLLDQAAKLGDLDEHVDLTPETEGTEKGK